MKILRWCLPCLVILVLSTMAITGCGVSQSDYDAVKNELDAIKEVYPPGEFSSRIELEDWLSKNNISEKPDSTYVDGWFSKALEIQEDALLDGYIVSADYDYFEDDDLYTVFCTTIIEGYVWYWDPESDEVFSDAYLGKVK